MNFDNYFLIFFLWVFDVRMKNCWLMIYKYVCICEVILFYEKDFLNKYLLLYIFVIIEIF